MEQEPRFLTILPKSSTQYEDLNKLALVLKSNELTGSTPMFQVVHNLIEGLEEQGLLSDDWIVNRYEQGKVIIHKDFLAIQDEFAQLEGATANNMVWNAELATQSFRAYLETETVFQERHNRVYAKGLDRLNAETRTGIETPRETGKDTNQIRVLVAIPSPFDNPNLWQQTLGLPQNYQDKLNPWSKIHECGVILASRLYRDDNPRGHDYFSYAARIVNRGEAPSIADKFIITAKHEGSHGKIDRTVLSLLSISNSNPIDEGFVNAFSGEADPQTPTPITIEELIENPKPASQDMEPDRLAEYKREANYNAGAKFFYSIFEIIKTRENKPEEDTWATITAGMIESAFKLGQISLEETENTKISMFMKRLLTQLDISVDEVKAVYNRLNQPKSV